MSNTDDADRRASGRRKVLRTGIASYDDGRDLLQMKCTIYDMSGDSMKIRPELHGVLPAQFTLRLSTHEAYKCTVVRRSGYLIAVKCAAL